MHEHATFAQTNTQPTPERYVETKQKLMCHPLSAHHFEQYKNSESLHLIRQVYLSHPDEPFSLRLRETVTRDNTLEYSAALKSAGTATKDELSRNEIEIDISPELFAYYTDGQTLPTVHKMSVHVSPALSIDWVEDVNDTPLIEIEHRSYHPEDEWFFERHGAHLTPVTAPMRTMEELAHALYDKQLPVPKAPSARDVVARINEARAERSGSLVVTFTGRSGSGKSTLLHGIREHFESSASIAVISTDDYHRGQTWLTAANDGQPWQNWELPIVYDTAELARDLARLTNGEPIPCHRIDFAACERTTEGIVEPADIILVEGLYAGSLDIAPLSDLTIDVSTPLATCVGRRVMRDLRERPQFANPHASLRYILETVEPAYREQIASATTSRGQTA